MFTESHSWYVKRLLFLFWNVFSKFSHLCFRSANDQIIVGNFHISHECFFVRFEKRRRSGYSHDPIPIFSSFVGRGQSSGQQSTFLILVDRRNTKENGTSGSWKRESMTTKINSKDQNYGYNQTSGTTTKIGDPGEINRICRNILVLRKRSEQCFECEIEIKRRLALAGIASNRLKERIICKLNKEYWMPASSRSLRRPMGLKHGN